VHDLPLIVQTMDPLSDVLSMLKVRSYAARDFAISGEWSFRFGPHRGIKLLATTVGKAWLLVDGVEQALIMRPGDCLLLPSGRSFQVASDLNLRPRDGEQALQKLEAIERTGTNRMSDCQAFTGHFELEGDSADLLLDLLPPIVLVRGEQDKRTLRWCLERTTQELHNSLPGHTLIAQQMALTMLVQVLRGYLYAEATEKPGWLFALGNAQISRSLIAIHKNPPCSWTLASLARESGMSRTKFAVEFRRLVGLAPIEYLTRWRMTLAKDRLLTSSQSLVAIATAAGYSSESSFSLAFTRVVGVSPRRYVLEAKAAAVHRDLRTSEPSLLT
jgi:AraC-like DNA-binding protein